MDRVPVDLAVAGQAAVDRAAPALVEAAAEAVTFEHAGRPRTEEGTGNPTALPTAARVSTGRDATTGRRSTGREVMAGRPLTVLALVADRLSIGPDDTIGAGHPAAH